MSNLSPADELQAALEAKIVTAEALRVAKLTLDQKTQLIQGPIAGGSMAHLLCQEMVDMRHQDQRNQRAAQETFDEANLAHQRAEAAVEVARARVATAAGGGQPFSHPLCS